jgi:DNA-binding CsgD family transcriptional regulator
MKEIGMTSGAARRLTDRQRAVMERIDRRVPIKVIAQELGVSETRINQHIRALKDFYDAGNLGDLVENYRATLTPEAAEASAGNDLGSHADTVLLKPFSEAAYRYSQLSPAADPADFGQRDDPGQLVLSDAMPLIEQAPWLRQGEPRVVPGVLDGEHAVLVRLGAIVGIASGILAAVILAVTAVKTLSEATDKATYSAETRVAAGRAPAPQECIDGKSYPC